MFIYIYEIYVLYIYNSWWKLKTQDIPYLFQLALNFNQYNMYKSPYTYINIEVIKDTHIKDCPRAHENVVNVLLRYQKIPMSLVTYQHIGWSSISLHNNRFHHLMALEHIYFDNSCVFRNTIMIATNVSSYSMQNNYKQNHVYLKLFKHKLFVHATVCTWIFNTQHEFTFYGLTYGTI